MIPLKLMIKLDRPFLFLDYNTPDGTTRRRSIPIRQLQRKTPATTAATLDDIVNDIKVRHLKYLQSVSSQQLRRLIIKLSPTLATINNHDTASIGSQSNPLTGTRPIKKSMLPPLGQQLFNFGAPISDPPSPSKMPPAMQSNNDDSNRHFMTTTAADKYAVLDDDKLSSGDTESIPEDIIAVDDIEAADRDSLAADNNDHLNALQW